MIIDFHPQIFFKPQMVAFYGKQQHAFEQKPEFDIFIRTSKAKNENKSADFSDIKISVKPFGKIQKTNKDAFLYTITNKNGASVDLSSFGATITSIKIPDKNDKLVDVVQGYDSVTPYETAPVGHAGGTIGPVANKIDNGKFVLNNKTYILETNKDNGKTHCHGGSEGLDVKNWDGKVLDDGVEFTYLKKDMENGYPANVEIKVTYKFDNDNNLHIKYHATADNDTILNLTNHTYFNLDGNENTQENSIYNHIITIPNSTKITEINDISIPTGKFLDVKNTPFDFHKAKKIGDVINNKSQQLELAGGFDHNYCIDNYDGKTLIDAAYIDSEKTGIKLKVSTNLPAFQFYSANHLGKTAQPNGKTGSRYEKRSALCIEPQFYPNAINTKEFKEKGILPKNSSYDREIIYSFETNK